MTPNDNGTQGRPDNVLFLRTATLHRLRTARGRSGSRPSVRVGARRRPPAATVRPLLRLVVSNPAPRTPSSFERRDHLRLVHPGMELALIEPPLGQRLPSVEPRRNAIAVFALAALGAASVAFSVGRLILTTP